MKFLSKFEKYFIKYELYSEVILFLFNAHALIMFFLWSFLMYVKGMFYSVIYRIQNRKLS